MTPLFVALHALSAVLWVGGMAFAYLVLRPATGPLAGPDRLALWGRVLGRFLAGVWVAAALLVLTGHGMISLHFGGYAGLPLYVSLMMGLGWLMVLLFLHLWFAPYRRLRRALGAGDTAAAARGLDGVRRIVAVNLGLGLLVVAIGASGRYWPPL